MKRALSRLDLTCFELLSTFFSHLKLLCENKIVYRTRETTYSFKVVDLNYG